MNIFISQRMNGLNKELIEVSREEVKEFFGPDNNYIDNYTHPDLPKDANRVCHLGESIKQMSTADLVVFIDDWFNADGCNIEYNICKTYGITAAVLMHDDSGCNYMVKLS